MMKSVFNSTLYKIESCESKSIVYIWLAAILDGIDEDTYKLHH